MTLEEPYEIARGAYEQATNLFLRLETDDGLVGIGCAAPDEPVTGEKLEVVDESLRQVAMDLIGKSPLRRSRVLDEVQGRHPEQPSVLAAVDLALYDLLGQICRLPLWQLLGGFRSRIRTSITIGILPLDATLERAQHWWRQGFRSLKVKGGRDPDLDAERACRLREELGPKLDLRFDANQGYSVEQSVRFVRQSRAARISILEQPTPAAELDLLGEIRGKVDVPVMADESLRTLNDAFRLVRGRLCDVINIKLMKVGGFAEANRINAVAKSAGVPVMVGCGDESALAIAAALHFTLASKNVVYADLDGHIGLVGDPYPEAVVLDRGWLSTRALPGLGWTR
jgi:L-alanine-DL-glutamate epimerase-like enolase superfamily enzyme